ncbi:MAG: hypothetical protein MJ252_18225 [archaeon]|nr:hypothetical protein [archaeon]
MQLSDKEIETKEETPKIRLSKKKSKTACEKPSLSSQINSTLNSQTPVLQSNLNNRFFPYGYKTMVMDPHRHPKESSSTIFSYTESTASGHSSKQLCFSQFQNIPNENKNIPEANENYLQNNAYKASLSKSPIQQNFAYKNQTFLNFQNNFGIFPSANLSQIPNETMINNSGYFNNFPSNLQQSNSPNFYNPMMVNYQNQMYMNSLYSNNNSQQSSQTYNFQQMPMPIQIPKNSLQNQISPNYTNINPNFQPEINCMDMSENIMDKIQQIKQIKYEKRKYTEDNKNIIKIHNILSGLDKRTTVMIRNIPNKYTLLMLNEELLQRYENKYDLLYLPIDLENNCNLGFAFINFINPLHIIDFYHSYRGKKWIKFASPKKCELVYAKIQGKLNLISHFEKGSNTMSYSQDKKPILIEPTFPRPKVIVPEEMEPIFKEYYPDKSYEKVSLGNENIIQFDEF